MKKFISIRTVAILTLLAIFIGSLCSCKKDEAMPETFANATDQFLAKAQTETFTVHQWVIGGGESGLSILFNECEADVVYADIALDGLDGTIRTFAECQTLDFTLTLKVLTGDKVFLAIGGEQLYESRGVSATHRNYISPFAYGEFSLEIDTVADKVMYGFKKLDDAEGLLQPRITLVTTK